MAKTADFLMATDIVDSLSGAGHTQADSVFNGVPYQAVVGS
jgi:hypothetical protein